ncbi:DNA-binding phage protein [Bradyrhizobium sp. USDA 3311]
MAKIQKKFERRAIEAEEDLLIDCQFLLQELIVKKGVSRGQLAERAGISKARLSQLLSADANPTLKTMASLLYALGERLCVSSAPCMSEDESNEVQHEAAEEAWQWTLTQSIADRGDDAEMVAIVKECSASNDNYSYSSEGLDPSLFELEDAA